MAIAAYGNTCKGNEEVNDDNCVVQRIGDYVVFMVADGNGGRPGMINIGALATSIMTDYLKKIINENTTILDIRNQLELGFYTVSKSFLTINALETKYQNIYASLSVMIVADTSLDIVLGSIGNTEIQLFRKGKFSRLNKIYSETAELLDVGEIQEREFYSHPKRSILTSALGVFGKPSIDIFSAKLEANDIVFLATDGVYLGMTPNDVLAEMGAHENSDDELKYGVEGVLKKTLDKGGLDNATLICIYVTQF